MNSNPRIPLKVFTFLWNRVHLAVESVFTFPWKPCSPSRGIRTSGSSRKIDSRLHERILRRLDRLDAATSVKQMDMPGFDFHPLHGKPQRYSVHVNGPWCLTFEFVGGDALRVDLEQYH